MSMRTLDIKNATLSLAEYANEVGEGPIIITREGRPVAVVLSVENADLETISLSTNPRFIALIEHSRKRQESEGGISSEEMRERLSL